jgi:hypothetical protein
VDLYDREISTLLADLTGGVRQAVGRDLVGLAVYGSLVSGDFDPDVSDLDLVAVTAVDAADLDLASIEAMHAGFAERHSAWADRVEVVYVGQDALRNFRTSAGRIAVISPGEPFHLRPEPPGDWIQNWFLVRESGVPLHGVPPTAWIPAVGWAEFVAASKRYAAELAARDLSRSSAGSLAYTLLTICRIEEVVIGGTRVSKREAAETALVRHPRSASVIREAVECRLTNGRIGLDQLPVRQAAIRFIRKVARSL